MSTSAEHAVIASELLDSLDRWRERVRNMTDHERLEMMAPGFVPVVNATMDFTVALAQAHAAASLALAPHESAEPLPTQRDQ
jgi:transposase